VVLRRERKWIRMLDKWSTFMSTNYRKVRERCRKGIPPSVRPRAWANLCGGGCYCFVSGSLHGTRWWVFNSKVSFRIWKKLALRNIPVSAVGGYCNVNCSYDFAIKVYNRNFTLYAVLGSNGGWYFCNSHTSWQAICWQT